MKKSFILLSLSMVSLISCGSMFKNTPWSWDESTKNYAINYCLLIGQLDHNDSMYRTRGTREILGTRVDKKYQKANFNLEDVKQGEIELGEGRQKHKFKVNELESLEQKSLAGATWDPITANTTTATWINKHDKHITMFVSNNDGMAKGAMHAYNWKRGMPIFGYDSNTSTLELMNEGESIYGTIDSNTPGQCLAASVLIRNILNASEKKMEYAKNGNPRSLIEKMWEDEQKPYNPIYEGFQYDEQGYATEAGTEIGGHIDITYGSGYVHSTVTFDGCLNKDLTNPSFDEENKPSHHAILLKNRTVTKYSERLKNKGIDDSAVDVDYFFKEKDGKKVALKSPELFEKAEGNNVDNPIKPNELKSAKICQTWYSKTDDFFTGNMNPLFDVTNPKLGLAVDYPVEGDGADEKVILDSLDAVLKHAGATDEPKAFLINPVQQSNSIRYIENIASAYNLKEQDDWSKRSDIPVVFWNRQPTDAVGKISTDEVMNNKYFKYTYYVGFDAKQGGELQGKMIKAWLDKTYSETNGGNK